MTGKQRAKQKSENVYIYICSLEEDSRHRERGVVEVADANKRLFMIKANKDPHSREMEEEEEGLQAWKGGMIVPFDNQKPDVDLHMISMLR